MATAANVSTDFDGCVIAESLRDPTLVDELRVWRTWVSPKAVLSDDRGTLARWHVRWVTCSAADIDRVQRQLKPWRWYAHFWRGTEMVVVYSDARFHVDRFDRSTWTPAIDHGKAKGIPEEQLDFLIIDHDT
jgi:hypothetical protein